MRHLYPAIKPYLRHTLKVDDIHHLYLDENGNQQGIPVIFIHSGPGGGCNRDSRRYFDPNIYRIITWDQRGCGRSTPQACLEDNTVAHLVQDMEKIKNYLQIGRWVIFGEGWGGTLGLRYTLAYPDSVLAIISSGIFLGTQADIHWIYQHGLKSIFPDYWNQFIENIPEKQQSNPLAFYYDRLINQTNDLIKMSYAKAWGLWMTRCSTLRLNQKAIDDFQDNRRALTTAKIAIHFSIHDYSMTTQDLFKQIESIRHIPGIFIHGRYDMLSPVSNSFRLAQHWPAAECQIVRDAGHSAIDPAMQDALVLATEVFANRFKNEFNLNHSS